MNPDITIRTLTDGGQPALDIAARIAGFLDGAERSLELAQYDFDLGPETAAIVGDAIRRAAGRGVRIRLAYNVDHARPVPVPPPSSPDEKLIESLPVEAFPIAGVPDLMHHKYVIRDSRSVWTGSTNWTDDAWDAAGERDRGRRLARRSRRRSTASSSSCSAPGPSPRPGASPPEWHDGVRAWFTPGHGEDLSHRVAQAIGRARRRVRICSPVLTTPPVLGALAERDRRGTGRRRGLHRRPADAGTSRGSGAGQRHWKVPLLERIAARFSAKASTPYGAGDVHDFMHAKVTVVDDTVFLGSFNLSRSGERNAENVLEIEDAGLADELAAFVDGVRARYAPLAL